MADNNFNSDAIGLGFNIFCASKLGRLHFLEKGDRKNGKLSS